jgi:hypothetical protein
MRSSAVSSAVTLDDAMLGRDVGRLEGRCDKPMGGRDVDDPAEAILPHRRQREPRGVEGRRQVDCEDLIPFLDRKLFKRRNMLNAGIVDENIEPAALRDVAAIISAIDLGLVMSAGE